MEKRKRRAFTATTRSEQRRADRARTMGRPSTTILERQSARARLRPMSEADRLERAKARRERGMTVERIESLDGLDAFHQDASVEERLTAMTRLCRAAWLATGRPFPRSSRSDRASLPGEIFVPDHAAS